MANRAPPPPPPASAKPPKDPLRDMETYNSQDFLEYMNEIRHARRDSDDVPDDDNPPEEGEEEMDFLKQTGFDSLVSVPDTTSEETAEDWSMLNSLSIQQAAVVKRRVVTLRNTLRRRSKDKGRHTDMRQLFPSESGGGDSRSRSATPDSLDSLSPPLTPPDACSRLEAGSPHSQGYHSSSRGSLDQLERPDDDEREKAADYRHVLRIPLAPETPGSQTLTTETDLVQLRRNSHDALDRAGGVPAKARSLFESTGHYKPSRKSAPPDSKGIEVVSYHQLGSIRRHSDRPGLGELGELHIPRVKAGPRADGSQQLGDDDKCRLGRTLIDDLSDRDAKRVQKLALLELTVIFDEHGLSYSRRKARRRRLRARPSVSEGAVFNCPLTTLLERDRQRQPDTVVPLLLERVLTHLEQRGMHEEGLLRVPGHQQKVDQLRRTVDERFYSRPGDVDEALRASGANDVAALVKLFLRELPAPLLTRECMDAFYQSDALPAAQQPAALALLCLQLPAPNRAVLRRLLQFLGAVVAREDFNKMSLENVAMIMAPNLLWPAQRRQKDISVEIEYAAVTSRVVRSLIRCRDALWHVPASLVGQLRRLHEAEQQEKARKEPSRQMKKFLRKKDASNLPKIDNEKDFKARVVRVTAPQFVKTSWPVQLSDDSTARDLVAGCLQPLMTASELASRIQGRRDSHSRQLDGLTPGGSTVCLRSNSGIGGVLATHFLFEHDGNIDQRRLEHDAVVLDCYRENPNARWEIHCCHGADRSSSVEIVAD